MKNGPSLREGHSGDCLLALLVAGLGTTPGCTGVFV